MFFNVYDISAYIVDQWYIITGFDQASFVIKGHSGLSYGKLSCFGNGVPHNM